MNIQKLFQGIAVVIDDEIKREDSSIVKIKQFIESKYIPVMSYSELPQRDMIPSLAKASFIILDWDYFGSADMGSDGERITIPTALKDEQECYLLSFIEQLIKQSFMPIFLFTNKSLEEVTAKLHEKGLWNQDKPKRIFVKQKDELSSEEQLFGEIEKWLKEVPSVYVLKEWESIVLQTKTAMFLELFEYSPRWTTIVWDMLKVDSRENHHEFGNFISRSLLSRMNGYNFDEAIIASQLPPSKEELRKIAQGERYIHYEHQPDQSYTGDLYKKDSKYYLNIRAQCDLAHPSPDGTYNPILYCIVGERLRSKDIVTTDIRLTSEGTLVFGKDKQYTLDQMQAILGDEAKLIELNKQFAKQRNNIFFRYGTFLERSDKVIVGCIANEQAIQFDLEIDKIRYEEYKTHRIGRLLPPYIERVQQKCAQYMIREGTMPIPHAVYVDFDG